MKSCCTNRSTISSYGFVFLGLAFLVFTWGLQYKVSLYAGPDSTIHHMVKAKLLANEETSGISDGLHLGAPARPVQTHSSLLFGAFWVGLLAVIFSSVISVQVRGSDASARSWRVCTDSSLSAIFSRPPPILN